MKETKVFELVETLLREQGFIDFSKTHSAHSATLSAEKGAHRLVLHITDKLEAPQNFGRNEKIPAASAIKATARLPGITLNAAGQVVQRAGQGAAVRPVERAKPNS